jgi:hypothetical protein
MREREEKSDLQPELLKKFSDEQINQMDLAIKYDLAMSNNDLSVDINKFFSYNLLQRDAHTITCPCIVCVCYSMAYLSVLYQACGFFVACV